MAVRRFTNTTGNHFKFWEIETAGKTNHVRYGRIGSEGHIRTKRWYSSLAALRAADKLIGTKMGKGYVESVAESAVKRAAEVIVANIRYDEAAAVAIPEPDIPEGRMITFGDEE